MLNWSLFHWLVLALFLYLLWLALRPKKKPAPAPAGTATSEIAPSATVDGSQTAALPALWNPFATANWSLLFTPIFGAILLSMHWTALGESSRGKRALAWAFATPFVIVALVLLGALGGAQGRGVVGLLQSFLYFSYVAVWYFVSARPQGAYVKSKYQESYPRKAWTVPVIVGLVLLAVLRNVDRYIS